MTLFFLAAVMLAHAAPSDPSPQPQPSAVSAPATQAPAPGSTTTPDPHPGPSGSPSAAGSGSPPPPTPVPVYNFVYKPTPSAGSTPFPELGAPEIFEIDVTDQTIAAPGPLHVRVHASDSTVSVVAESFGYEFSIPKTGIGRFAFDGIIPPVPDSVKGKRFDVNVTATSKNGRILQLTLPFMLK